MKRITFITGNKNKLKEFQSVMGEEFLIDHKALDLPELQGEVIDVAKEKAKAASALVEGPILIEDTSLSFNALGGLPGPYIKWFLSKLGLDGLNQMLVGFEDHSAIARCIFVYCAGAGHEAQLCIGETKGKIVPPRGSTAFGWDAVFEEESTGLTYGEMTLAQKNLVSHRSRALTILKEVLG